MQELRSLDGPTPARVRAVAVTPDGHQAVSASDDGTLKVWDLETGQALRTLKGHTNYVFTVVVTPDGRRAVSASSDNTLKVWDLKTGQTLRTLEGHTEMAKAVAVTPDGRRAVSASYDKSLKMWDLESGACLATFLADGTVWCCAITPNGWLIVAGEVSGQIHFLQVCERGDG
jgi:WD40 repeat protein